MVVSDDSYAALQLKGATSMVGRKKMCSLGRKKSLGKLRLWSCAEKEFAIVKEKLPDLHKNNRKVSVRARPYSGGPPCSEGLATLRWASTL